MYSIQQVLSVQPQAIAAGGQSPGITVLRGLVAQTETEPARQTEVVVLSAAAIGVLIEVGKQLYEYYQNQRQRAAEAEQQENLVLRIVAEFYKGIHKMLDENAIREANELSNSVWRALADYWGGGGVDRIQEAENNANVAVDRLKTRDRTALAPLLNASNAKLACLIARHRVTQAEGEKQNIIRHINEFRPIAEKMMLDSRYLVHPDRVGPIKCKFIPERRGGGRSGSVYPAEWQCGFDDWHYDGDAGWNFWRVTGRGPTENESHASAEKQWKKAKEFWKVNFLDSFDATVTAPTMAVLQYWDRLRDAASGRA